MKNLAETIKEKADRSYARSLLVKLARVPTPQTDLFEKEPLVQSFVSDVIQPELKSIGVKGLTIDDVGNLVCSIGRGRSGKRLAYAAYAMTHPASSMKNPYSGEIVDGAPYGVRGECVWGRGVCEQKGAFASMIASMRLLVEAGIDLNGELVFITSTAGETGRHDSLRHIIEVDGVKANYGVIGLGTSNKVCLANKGRIDVMVTVKGTSCHSSTPWLGVNAAEGANLVLNRLREMKLQGRHPHLGKVTLTCTSIETSPKATHTVPNTAKMVFDRRLLPGQDPEYALRQIRRALHSTGKHEVIVDMGPFMYPSEVKKNAKISMAISEAVKTLLKRRPEYIYSHGCLDAGFLNKMGIETVMFGPGDMRFQHTDNEVVRVDDVLDATKLYAYTAASLLK